MLPSKHTEKLSLIFEISILAGPYSPDEPTFRSPLIMASDVRVDGNANHVDSSYCGLVCKGKPGTTNVKLAIISRFRHHRRLSWGMTGICYCTECTPSREVFDQNPYSPDTATDDSFFEKSSSMRGVLGIVSILHDLGDDEIM